MTAKAKAEELVNKFYDTLPQWVNREDAKQCALIAVDELIKNSLPGTVKNYWEQVKSEFSKL